MTQRSKCFRIIWWGQCFYIKGEDFIFSIDLSKVNVLRTNSTKKIGKICNPCALNLKEKKCNLCALNMEEKKCNICALYIDEQFVTHSKEGNLTHVLLIWKRRNIILVLLIWKGRNATPVFSILKYISLNTQEVQNRNVTQTLRHNEGYTHI